MAEIFQRVRPSEQLAFTGERMTGAMQGQIEIEHLHRYFLAREASRDLDVLDIACGEGYGSALLAQVARSVVGVDVSPEAVQYAQGAYQRDNLRFLLGDGRQIPVADASVDVVASFETLEHLYEQEAFLAECKRVLRPGGLLLISTPDRDVYSPEGSIANRYHVRELDHAEFRAAVEDKFKHVAVLRQRPMLGSAILPVAPREAQAPHLTFEQRGPDTFEAGEGLRRALYFVAYCSDAPLSIPSASLYIETSQIELRAAEAACENEGLRFETRQARAEVRQKEAELAGRAQELANIRAWSADIERVAVSRLLERQDLERQLADVTHRLNQVHASTSWRLTSPLRGVVGAFPPGARRLPLTAAKLVYWSLTLQLPRRLKRRRDYFEALRQSGTAAAAEADRPAETTGTADARVRLTEGDNRIQRRRLGAMSPQPRLSIAVGVVTYNNSADQLRKCLASASIALARAGGTGSLLAIDNGGPSVLPEGVTRIESAGNIGFGAAHNRLMEAAFAQGADIYIAVNPDGMFHPDCIAAIARMHAAHGGQALIEACQFPAEHPKVYDPLTLETAWASGACLAVPRQIHGKIGGFDDTFFMYCEDVDLSWRARAAGFSVLFNPTALFLHAVTNRPDNSGMWAMMLASGHLLGRKWGNAEFTDWTREQLERLSLEVPAKQVEVVPEAWRDVADFSRHFSFSPVRW